jgi:hypothetical protein
MRLLSLALFPVLLALAASAPASAQDDGTDRPADAVRQTVTDLFDGMRAADSAAVRAVLHPGVRFLTAPTMGDPANLTLNSVDGLLQAVATAPVTFDERVGEVEVRVDDGLATAWMPYRFYADDEFIHCGVNAMQLVRHAPPGEAPRWRIVQIIDTRRTTCE